ncbi:MAG: nitroreductase family protein [Bacteroidales bacterium]|jgi:nitroreductase/NAD-dependent dihydropyrimidine dehydrogenase PreA subunit
MIPASNQTTSFASHSIDAALCTDCALCVAICPAGILSRDENKKIYFRTDRVDICIKCGHCMAMCEAGAIMIDGLSYEDNFRPLPQTIIDNEAFMDFLLTRRSVRFFKDKPVPAELLRKIVDSLSTAPFGVDPGNVELTVVNDKKIIEKAWPYMSKMYIQLAKMLKTPVVSWFIKRLIHKEARETLINFIVPHVDKGLYDSSTGIDDITRNAPAMILFHGRKKAGEHIVDAHIYCTYAMLTAHSLGLGATIIGLIGPPIDQNKALKEIFKIPEGNEVVEALIIGYPKYSFKRAIVRPRTKVTFIS